MSRILVLTVILLTFGSVLAFAQPSKLSPRARIALSQLQEGISPRDIIQLTGAPVTATGELDVFISGNVSRAELEAAGAVVRTEIPGGIFTAFVPLSAIDAVEALVGVERIDGAVTYEENLNASVPTTIADIQRTAGPTFAGANGAGVLIGDIDSGISYAHGDFDNAAGNTRILRIWDHNIATGPAPAGYAYGTEYLPAAIDANTAQGKDTNGHGTHVMGIAAGDGSLTGGAIPAYTYTGMAPMADIVEIKPVSYTDTAILDGAAYFFGLATSMGKNAVLNISLGGQYGPHDGTQPLSVGLDALTGPGKAICASAGNDGAITSPSVSHRHARVNYGPTYPTPVSAVLTLAGSASGRIVGVSGVYDNLDAVNVTISHPTYGSFGPYTLGTINAGYPGVTFGTSGKLYVENGAYNFASGDREIYVEIRASSASTFNGNWTFTFTPTAPAGPQNGRIDLWQFYVSTTAISAYFSSGADDNVLLGGDIACSNNVITCGAWITKTGWTNCANLGISYGATTPPTTVGLLASFSSNGPTRDGRMKPEIAAPGQGIGAATTQDVAYGTCTTTSAYYSFLNDNMKHVINAGTSMAAPHVTGAVALLFQKFGPLTKAQIMTKLSALALVDGSTGSVPNNSWGAGKLRVDVTNPQVTVTSPNGGELWYTGQAKTFTWNASDPVWSGVVSVDLLLSRDNGGSWENIALGVGNTGTYPWTVTGPITAQAIFRVKAHDVADNIGEDVSDAIWAIAEVPVAVELSLFRAEPTDAGVKISWKYADQGAYVSTSVERGLSGDGPWAKLEAPLAQSESAYSITDESGSVGTTYFYRLQAVSRDGGVTTFGPISAMAGRPITEFMLMPAWPNPTRGLARVDFAVPRDSHVSLKVFDVQGRVVSTLADRDFAPGRYQTAWDGTTSSGAPASSGVYFIHLVSPAQQFVQRVTLAR